MLNLAVMVSGGGTNLQAIIDQIENGSLPGVGLRMSSPTIKTPAHLNAPAATK